MLRSAARHPWTALAAAALALAGCTKKSAEPIQPAEDEDPSAETAAAAGQAGTAEGAGAGEGPAKNGPLPPDDPALAAPPDVAAPPEDAKKSDSGLAWKILRPGTGEEHPSPEDRVTVHYTGWTTDGKRFDSSLTRGSPATFGVSQVIAGWTEALQLMVEGEKRRVWIPAKLAYEGKSGPQGMLVFDVELLEIQKPPKPPEDLDSPPEDAERTEGGVIYKELEAGDGTENPGPESIVTIDYSIWSQDGRLVQSSEMMGRPRTTDIRTLLPGWKEATLKMVKGDSWRLWIPQDQAFQGRPRTPQGTIVIDVTLVDIMSRPAAGGLGAPAKAKKAP